VGELPENPSMKNPSPNVEVAGVQPHDAHHSPLTSSLGHSEWPVVAPGQWAIEVVEVGQCRVGLGHAQVRLIPQVC
jgi:hypothetical protein